MLRSFLFPRRGKFLPGEFRTTLGLQRLRAGFVLNHADREFHLRPNVHLPKDECGFDLRCDVPSLAQLFYGEPDAITNAIGYAQH